MPEIVIFIKSNVVDLAALKMGAQEVAAWRISCNPPPPQSYLWQGIFMVNPWLDQFSDEESYKIQTPDSCFVLMGRVGVRMEVLVFFVYVCMYLAQI